MEIKILIAIGAIITLIVSTMRISPRRKLKTYQNRYEKRDKRAKSVVSRFFSLKEIDREKDAGQGDLREKINQSLVETLIVFREAAYADIEDLERIKDLMAKKAALAILHGKENYFAAQVWNDTNKNDLAELQKKNDELINTLYGTIEQWKQQPT